LTMKRLRSEGGFNFIELTVAIALMGILAVVSLSSMSKYTARRDILQGGRQLAGDLRLTQQFAMTQGQNFKLVYAASSTSSYTIVKSSDSSVSKSFLLPSSLIMTSTFTGNTAEFAATGAPVQSGTFCLSAGVSTKMKVDVLAGTGRTTDQEVTTCP